MPKFICIVIILCSSFFPSFLDTWLPAAWSSSDKVEDKFAGLQLTDKYIFIPWLELDQRISVFPAPLARLTTGGGGGVFYQFLESLSGSTDSGRDGRKGSVSISLFDVL